MRIVLNVSAVIPAWFGSQIEHQDLRAQQPQTLRIEQQHGNGIDDEREFSEHAPDLRYRDAPAAIAFAPRPAARGNQSRQRLRNARQVTFSAFLNCLEK